MNVDPSQIMLWIRAHQWAPVIAVIVGLVVRLVKDDGAKLPAPWRAPFAALVAITITASAAIVGGGAWQGVLENGLISFALAVIGHETIVEGVRGGVEIPMPFLKPANQAPSMETKRCDEAPPPPDLPTPAPPEPPKAA